jgi:hypothetical protein
LSPFIANDNQRFDFYRMSITIKHIECMSSGGFQIEL